MVEIPDKLIDSKGKRLDGRTAGQMRDYKITANVLNNADGSALIQWGNNRILVGVRGPRECLPRHMANPYRAVIKCKYNMCPFASPHEHGRSGPSRRSHELSKVIREALENVVILEKFPNSEIDVFIEVLSSDGGTRCASLTAASVALADAGIPMKDLIQSVAPGMVEDKVVLDLNYIEDSAGGADMAVGMTHNDKDVVLFQMEGHMSKKDMEQAFDLVKKASDEIRVEQVRALKEAYSNKTGCTGLNF